MSWVTNYPFTLLQKFCINVIKCGPIPSHLAFIMDGNRRYATKTNVKKAEGHSKGFEKLGECLQWCRELGIREVTVYAFSIENFKRSKEEVDTLMQLAREKFQKVFEEKDKLKEEGVCIRVIGNLSLLPQDIRKLIAEAMLLTKDNNKSILNVAFSYTSSDEITNSIKEIVDGVNQNLIDVEDITEELISNCLYTHSSSNPEVLIRTSGEVRLSDFLLWQVSESEIFFTDVLWPEFCIWHLLGCVFKYQRSYNYLKKFDYQYKIEKPLTKKVQSFVDQLAKKRFEQLELYAKS
nr:dehydrodolichyl diphosphate synthase complex subunit DHDDS [Leptinotarsa decemlineata]